MQIISFLAFVSLFTLARAHAGHDAQVPFDYVKFPFQPIYRGKNGEGEIPSYLRK